MAVDNERLLAIWLRFLHGFALSDHLGDASDDVRALAQVLALPEPPDNAGLDEWLTWVSKEYGVDESLHSLIIRERESQPKSSQNLYPTLHQRLDAFLKAQGF